jgi:hypothetical protein
MMKKLMLLLVLGVVFISGVFGSGEVERIPIFLKNRIKEFSISLNEHYGVAYINIGLKNANTVKHCLLKNGDDYFNISGEIHETLNGQDVSKLFKNEHEKKITILNTITMNWKSNPENCKCYYGHYLLGIGIPGNLTKLEKANIKIPVRYGFLNNEFELLLIYNNSDWEKYKFTFEIDFFSGEKALYTQQETQIDYKYFCYAFMKDFFITYDDQNEETITDPDFLKAAKESFNDENIDSHITNYTINYDGIVNGYSKKTFQENYKKSLNVHFIKKYEERKVNDSGEVIKYPYFDCARNELFDCIYSEKKNIYISTYLHLLFEKNKPVTSQIIKEKLKKINIK